tara:strand:- start:51249 stop:51428 length:180 start_codon:yes stop_codon:yes gene_type:complete
MTDLEKEILDMVHKGLLFNDYLGDGEWIEVCPLCNAAVCFGKQHTNDCPTTLLRKERDG